MDDRAQIRAFVYERLKQPLPNHLAALGVVVSEVQLKAENAGLADKAIGMQPSQSFTSWIEDEVREIIWALTFQGIIVPGVDSGNQASLPYFKITEWGKRCLERGEYLPFDVDQYITRFRAEVQSKDPAIELYLLESLNCFQCGSFVASAVMVGVASERLILLLKNAVYHALDDDQKQKRFEEETTGLIKRIYDAIWKRLDPVREQMPDKLPNSIGVELVGVFELIRKTRNEGGHPSGRNITREEAEALLLLFPTYAKTVLSVNQWLLTIKI